VDPLTPAETKSRFFNGMLAPLPRKVARAEPTIDRIEVAGFESQEEQREWLTENAPAFLRQ
jgi:hypothetical protein